MPYIIKFRYLCAMNLSALKQRAVEAMGFDRLNAMQEQMLEAAASGKNVMLLSPTGSGKTVAFLLPLMAQEPFHALCIVPSRELAQQIGEVARKLGIRTVVCYGGHDVRIENDRLAALTGNAEQLAKSSFLLVSTSGRCKDHLERQHINPSIFTHLILDEYDKSLELGFEEEVRFIVQRLSMLKQRVLTSATHGMPIAPWLNMKPYEQVASGEVANKDDKGNEAQKYAQNKQLTLWQVKSPIADKLETLKELLLAIEGGQTIVFSNYRESSERIAHFLIDNGIGCALYHGGMDQDMRDKALIRFRQQSIGILVSTDLASRGLDIPDVTHVIHYHLPADEEAFTHRNGRTARAGASGNAYLIIGPNEFVPEYIASEPPYFTAKKAAQNNNTTEPQNNAPTYATVYIGRGKKEKISKGDIVGFFTKNGGIDGSQIGRIDVMEHCSYCAICTEVVHDVLTKVKGLKIKGEKTLYKIVDGN